jgi:predicted Fe-S protein YdhL (DUF1289 family)
MSEEVLSSEERLAILGQLAARKPVDEKKEVTTGNANEGGAKSFGQLLEESLKKQAIFKQEDDKMSDETRQAVIEKINPRFDIMKSWRF